MTQEPQQYPPAQQPPAAYYPQQAPPPAQHVPYAPPAAAKPAASLPPAIGGLWTVLGVGFAVLVILIGFIGALVSNGNFGAVGFAMLSGGLLLLTLVLFAEIIGTGISRRLNNKD